MKHKIIYGSVGLAVAGVAIAVPLAVTLTDTQDDYSLEQAERQRVEVLKDNAESQRDAAQEARDQVASDAEAAAKAAADAQKALDEEIDRLAAAGKQEALDAQQAREEAARAEAQRNAAQATAERTRREQREAQAALDNMINDLADQGNADAQMILQKRVEIDYENKLLFINSREIDQVTANLQLETNKLNELTANNAPQGEISTQQQIVNDLTTELDGLNVKHTEIESRISTLEGELQTVITTLVSANASVGTLQNDLDTANAAKLQAERDLAAAITARDRNQANLDEAARKLSDASADVSRLNRELASKTDEYNTAHAAQEEAVGKLAEAEAKVRSLEEQIASMSSSSSGGNANDVALKQLTTNRWSTSLLPTDDEFNWANPATSNLDYFAQIRQLIFSIDINAKKRPTILTAYSIDGSATAGKAAAYSASISATWPVFSHSINPNSNAVLAHPLRSSVTAGSAGLEVTKYLQKVSIMPTSAPSNWSRESNTQKLSDAFFEAKLIIFQDIAEMASIDLSRNVNLEALVFEDPIGIPATMPVDQSALQIADNGTNIINLDLSKNVNLRKLNFTNGYYGKTLDLSKNVNLDYLNLGRLQHKVVNGVIKPAIDFIDISMLTHLTEFVGMTNNMSGSVDEKGLKFYPITVSDTTGTSIMNDATRNHVPLITKVKIAPTQVKMILDMMKGSFDDKDSSTTISAATIANMANLAMLTTYEIGDKSYKVYPYSDNGRGTSTPNTKISTQLTDITNYSFGIWEVDPNSGAFVDDSNNSRHFYNGHLPS